MQENRKETSGETRRRWTGGEAANTMRGERKFGETGKKITGAEEHESRNEDE